MGQRDRGRDLDRQRSKDIERCNDRELGGKRDTDVDVCFNGVLCSMLWQD